MDSADGPVPSDSARLAAREDPGGPAVMRQRWESLLFLHWPVEPGVIQATLPAGLRVDTFSGQAWLGVVPFRMSAVRPVGLPPVPWISWFAELNVRTYVFDRDGLPGVWFYSLDCNQPLAVQVARTLFHLPYHHACMSVQEGSVTHYRCRRRGKNAEAFFCWEGHGSPQVAVPGSLPFFLLERYHLYASKRGRLFRGQVSHRPYEFRPVRLESFSLLPVVWDGLPEPAGPPVHACEAQPVEVRIHPLRAAPVNSSS